jgi:hypothetical protein
MAGLSPEQAVAFGGAYLACTMMTHGGAKGIWTEGPEGMRPFASPETGLIGHPQEGQHSAAAPSRRDPGPSAPGEGFKLVSGRLIVIRGGSILQACSYRARSHEAVDFALGHYFEEHSAPESI